ncbi:Uncharacterized protein APZ42_032807 [Daphnia magna]|uniref:Uncharacterized protein n=1 Tax=Daphnia magna TaxID=35525 RepID=A0A162D947_9CRUS|nr:Uncharacterized protein APZ42_032807 [Daphnia magna]
MTDGLWIYKEELKQFGVIVLWLPFIRRRKTRSGKSFLCVWLVLSHSSVQQYFTGVGANLGEKVITSAVTPRYEERRR